MKQRDTYFIRELVKNKGIRGVTDVSHYNRNPDLYPNDWNIDDFPEITWLFHYISNLERNRTCKEDDDIFTEDGGINYSTLINKSMLKRIRNKIKSGKYVGYSQIFWSDDYEADITMNEVLPAINRLIKNYKQKILFMVILK